MISDSLRNRGVAFDRQHRRQLGLAGWLLALVAVVVLLSVSGAGRRAPAAMSAARCSGEAYIGVS